MSKDEYCWRRRKCEHKRQTPTLTTQALIGSGVWELLDFLPGRFLQETCSLHLQYSVQLFWSGAEALKQSESTKKISSHFRHLGLYRACGPQGAVGGGAILKGMKHLDRRSQWTLSTRKEGDQFVEKARHALKKAVYEEVELPEVSDLLV